MANAIDGADEGQWPNGVAALLQIWAYEDMAAEHFSNVVRIGRVHACRQIVQRRPDDVRCSAELGKIGIFANESAPVAPNITIPHIPAVLSKMAGNETRQAAADEIVIIHNHHV